jgi:striatin 1/3/4
MKEIQYLLTPPQHPPPPQILPNGNYTGLPEAPLSVEEYYARQQQQQLHNNIHAYSQPTAAPNHLPPPVPNSLPQSYNHQEPLQTRGQQHQDYPESQQPLPEPQQQVPQQDAGFEVPVVNVTHTFDNNGQPIPGPEAQRTGVPQTKQQDPDGWTFEEEPQLQTEHSQANVSPRRPDTDLFPSAASSAQLPAKSPPRTGPASHRRKSSGSTSMSRRRSSQGKNDVHDGLGQGQNADPTQFKVKFALRGHLDVVRSVIFSGGGSPGEPEVCTAGDDGTIKRWIIPASYQNFNATTSSPDLDVQAIFTHRGHEGIVTSLASCSASGFNTGGRASGDGWIFSGGQDATIRVWERGRVDPKETLQGHTDAVWSVCILPTTVGDVFGSQSNNFGGPERLLLVSGSADGTVKVWAVSAPPQSSSPSTGSRRGVGGSRRHSVTSGSNFPSSPQPSVASTTPFTYTLVHSIERPATGDSKASPTSIAPLSATGENFVVSYTDSSVLIFDTKTGEEIIGMASNETYDGTMGTSINTVVATSMGLEGAGPGLLESSRGLEPEEVAAGATGSREGVEGVVITGHEDRFVRFFDANSGKLCSHLTWPLNLKLTCLQANAPTPCSPTPPLSQRSASPRMAVRPSPPATTPASVSGPSRSESAPKISCRTEL